MTKQGRPDAFEIRSPGGGGTLSGAGLAGAPMAIYTLSGSAASVTEALGGGFDVQADRRRPPNTNRSRLHTDRT